MTPMYQPEYKAIDLGLNPIVPIPTGAVPQGEAIDIETQPQTVAEAGASAEVAGDAADGGGEGTSGAAGISKGFLYNNAFRFFTDFDPHPWNNS